MTMIHLQVWTPSTGFWAAGMRDWLGDPARLSVAEAGDESVEVALWTMPDAVAQDRRVVRKLFAETEVLTGRGDMSDERKRFWPRISFSTDESSAPPRDLLTLDHTEVVGGTDSLWFHFVDDTDDPPYTCTYRRAVEDGVWGIEEGYCEGGTYPEGWWVTVSPTPGERPNRLHSVF